MSIVTQAILEKRIPAAELIRLTDDAGSGVVNANVLAQAIADGEAEILVNVGQRYTLPLSLDNTMTASVVTAKCLACVVYMLYLHRDQVVAEEVKAAHDAAVKWSEKIAAGGAGLLGESELAASPAAGGGMLIVGPESVITRESMNGL
jgi:phage gp36-like protein